MQPGDPTTAAHTRPHFGVRTCSRPDISLVTKAVPPDLSFPGTAAKTFSSGPVKSCQESPGPRISPSSTQLKTGREGETGSLSLCTAAPRTVSPTRPNSRRAGCTCVSLNRSGPPQGPATLQSCSPWGPTVCGSKFTVTHKRQTQGPQAQSGLHLVLSGLAPCFYPAAAPSSHLTVKE